MATDEGTTESIRDAQLVRVLLVEAREELLKADNKAGYLLASMGASLTALLSGIFGGAIQPRGYAVASQLLLWAGSVACLVSLALLGSAVTPRVGRPRRARAHYFGDVHQTASALRLRAILRRTDALERDLNQLTVLSRTVWIKYRCIRHAMVWSAAFIALTLLGVLTGMSN